MTEILTICCTGAKILFRIHVEYKHHSRKINNTLTDSFEMFHLAFYGHTIAWLKKKHQSIEKRSPCFFLSSQHISDFESHTAVAINTQTSLHILNIRLKRKLKINWRVKRISWSSVANLIFFFFVDEIIMSLDSISYQWTGTINPVILSLQLWWPLIILKKKKTKKVSWSNNHLCSAINPFQERNLRHLHVNK